MSEKNFINPSNLLSHSLLSNNSNLLKSDQPDYINSSELIQNDLTKFKSTNQTNISNQKYSNNSFSNSNLENNNYLNPLEMNIIQNIINDQIKINENQLNKYNYIDSGIEQKIIEQQSKEQFNTHISDVNNIIEALDEDDQKIFAHSEFLSLLKDIKQGKRVLEANSIVNVTNDQKNQEQDLDYLSFQNNINNKNYIGNEFSTLNSSNQNIFTNEYQLINQPEYMMNQEEIFQNEQFFPTDKMQEDLKEFKQELESVKKTNEQNYENIYLNSEYDDQDYSKLIEKMQEAEESKYSYSIDKNILENSNNINNYFEKALEYYHKNEYKDALSHFQKAVLTQNDSIKLDSFVYIGQIHQIMEEDDKAVGAFYQGLKLDPNHTELLLHASVSCTNQLDYGRVLDNFRKYLLSKYADLDPYTFTTPADMYLGNQMAIDEIRKVLQSKLILSKDKDSIEYYELNMALGTINFMRQDLDQARVHFYNLLKIEGNQGKAILWNRLGASFSNSSRYEEAELCYQKSLDIQNSARTWNNLGGMYFNQEDYKNALGCYVKSLEVNEFNDETWSIMSECAKLMDRYDLQEEFIQKNTNSLWEFEVDKWPSIDNQELLKSLEKYVNQ